MSVAYPSEPLDPVIRELQQDHGLTLNAAQRRRLAWLSARKGRPLVWTGRRPLPEFCRFVIVLDPPNSVYLELFAAALAPGGIVVVPCGEDSAYDALKSRLVGFGTVGTDGAAGPHQMWWGGRDWQALTTLAETGSRSLLELKPEDIDGRDGNSRAGLFLSVWQTRARPFLWVGHDRAADDAISIQALDCDFAVRKRAHWQFASDILYFGNRTVSGALLGTWAEFCRCFPAVDDIHLLDQAWCLMTSQAALDTVWLPERTDCSKPRAPDLQAGELPIDMTKRLEIARRADRTGLPELLMSAAAELDRRAIVIVRDAHSRGSRALAATIEALARAFAADAAGYRQVEVMLCVNREELHAALTTATRENVLVVTPAHRIADDAFRRLAEDSRLYRLVVPPATQVFDFASVPGHRTGSVSPAWK